MPEVSSTDTDSSSRHADYLFDDDDDDGYYEFAADVVQEQEDSGQMDLQRVTEILKDAGLPSINVILGISSKRSNAGSTREPYEEIMYILGNTLAPITKGNMFSCFGFGDQTTKDKDVFSFEEDHKPSQGIEKVLSRYRKIVPNMQFAGLTSFGPIIDAAIDIVAKNEGQFHTLFIITDDQVTRGINIGDDELSPQEEQTMKSIIEARLYPLSIVVIGVGPGTRENMQMFEKISPCKFENFKFVNYTKFMSKDATRSDNEETAFALAALAGIPTQYKKATKLGLLGQRRVTRSANGIKPLPPPGALYSQHATDVLVCPICEDMERRLVLGCGHWICVDCRKLLDTCPICRKPISCHTKLFI